jgi:5-methylcytosine-specific restriction endonuclease McrA
MHIFFIKLIVQHTNIYPHRIYNMTSRAKYGGANTKDKVWSHAATVGGKDPNTHRQDPYGNVMFKHSHGKSSAMGWDIDHIKPKSRGGSNDISNLQALNASLNRSKGNSLVKKSRHNQ